MYCMILVLYSLCAACLSSDNGVLPTENLLENSTDPNKDMYVIHAMVYQVGIITNQTDEEAANASTTGHQESVTFFKSNGTGIDLGNISTPLLTNVTAQSLVGVAPAPAGQAGRAQLPWSALENLASLQHGQLANKTRYTRADRDPHLRNFISLFKRSLNESQKFFDNTNKMPVKIENGVSVIPNEAGVKSLAIPPLISLNNNFSAIPVPIPNTSVVHYAKVNTLVSMP